MFSPGFEQVYREAFVAATGSDFDSNTDDYVDYTERTSQALLARWSDPNFDVRAITDLEERRQSQSFWIKHPSTEDFTEIDARNIAHVRYLGQAIIRAAQNSLNENPHINWDDERRFDGSEWHRRNEHVGELEVLGYDSNAPSPQRLREWPRGDYLNCLGISIAVTAESANRELPHFYMNRIRDARHESAGHALQFMERILNIAPRALDIESFMLHRVDSVSAELNGIRNKKQLEECFKCIRDVERLNTIFHYGLEFDTSFHHAVIRLEKDPTLFDLEMWTQVDPYALVTTGLHPMHFIRRAESEHKKLVEDGRCNEILMLDGDMQDWQIRRFGKLVEVAMRSRRRLRQVIDDYKAPDMMPRIKDELLKSCDAMNAVSFFGGGPINNISDAELFRTEEDDGMFPDDDIRNQKFEILWLQTLIDATQPAKAKKAYEEFIREEFGKNTQAVRYRTLLARNSSEKFAKKLQDVMRQDGETRRFFREMIEAIPFALALHAAERQIKATVFGPEPDKSLEACDPAFMIGSMYLNHFDRWREDGTIGVAKELARINPSQLIWQSAVSLEDGRVTDDRITALGGLVKSLKIGQQHPLVRATRPAKEK